MENCFFLPQAAGSEVYIVFALSVGSIFLNSQREESEDGNCPLACLTEDGPFDQLVGPKDKVLRNDSISVL